MKEAIIYFILVIGLISCNGNKELGKENSSIEASSSGGIPTKTTREEFWPLEREITRVDTTLHSGENYRIKIETKSLNDSAALYKATDEQGEIIIHAHNRISDITILKNGEIFLNARLTREIFKGRDELNELRLNYYPNFVRLADNEFIFHVEACVPDSDICDAAEIAINSKGQVRIIKYIEE